MAWKFPFFKKKNKEEVEETMTQDEKEIEKAKKDIKEKGPDSQTEKDRIDESVGEQEKRSGNENSQDAKDRVDESEGTKKADEKRAEEKKEEKKEEQREEKKEDKRDDLEERLEKFGDSLVEKLVAALAKHADREESTSHKANTADAEKLKQIEGLYN